MLIFKTIHDLQQLHPNHPAYSMVKRILELTAGMQGYLVLMEEGESCIDLPEVKGSLAEMPFEGVTKPAGFYHAFYLTNNEYGIDVLIPDTSELDADVRANMEAHRSEY